MPFKAIPITLSDMLILEPTIWSDERGFFFDSYNERCSLWNDPAIEIDWQLSQLNGVSPSLANKNLNGSLLPHAEVFD